MKIDEIMTHMKADTNNFESQLEVTVIIFASNR